MIYGPNSHLVDEVVEFVQGGSILAGGGTPLADEWDVLNDFEKAKRSAWEAVIGDQELLWTDVREKEISKIHAQSYGMPNVVTYANDLSTLLDTFTQSLKRSIPVNYREILDDPIGDLYSCALSRCVLGETDNLFENIFQAYRTGCWPCGWEGNYLQGRLRVSLPVKSEPRE